MARLWRRFADPAPCGTGAFRCFFAALTWRTYDFAMLLAVVYPVGALVFVWLVTGEEARIGFEPVFPAVELFSFSHIATIGLVALIAVSLKMNATPEYRRELGVSRADILFFTTLSLTILMGYLDVISSAIAVAAAVAAAAAGAGAIAVAIAGAVEKTDKADHGRTGRFAVTVLILSVLTLSAIIIPWQTANERQKAMFIFFGLFLLINAIFDTVSYAATLSLIRIGMRSKFWPALAFGFLDLAIGIVLFFGLGVTLIACAAILNALAGTPILDIGALLARIGQGPSADTS